MNNVVLIGRLTRDPELRYIPSSGSAVSNFTLAIDKEISKAKKQEMESKNQPTADFIRISTWGNVAENCAKYLAKGRLVAVQGRLQSGQYEKDGITRYTTEVVAFNVEFLEWGDKPQGNSQDQGSSTSDSSDKSDIDDFHPIDNDDIPF